MSCAVVRCPGFWNSVNSASSSRTIITQRAKLRRLAFIRRPYPPRSGAAAITLYAENSWQLHVCPAHNVGTARPRLERARISYILARFRPFGSARVRRLVKSFAAARRRPFHRDLAAAPASPSRRPGCAETRAFAAFSGRIERRFQGFQLASSTGPSSPTWAIARPSSRSAISAGSRAKPAASNAIACGAGSSTASKSHRPVDHGFDRRVRPLEPPRQQRKPAGVEAFARELRHQAAQPRPGEARIAVGRIVGERNLRRLQGGDEPRLRDVEQRADEHERRLCSLAGQPTESRVPSPPAR